MHTLRRRSTGGMSPISARTPTEPARSRRPDTICRLDPAARRQLPSLNARSLLWPGVENSSNRRGNGECNGAALVVIKLRMTKLSGEQMPVVEVGQHYEGI